MAQEKDRPFRVVVVGAGIVGLTLSHAFQLANIDHVVLEKHDKIVSLRGAALVVWPAVARIFDQFGILKGMVESITPCVCSSLRLYPVESLIRIETQRWPDGTLHYNSPAFDYMSKLFNTETILFDRQKCVEHLYNGLPDKSVIRTSTRVERIEHTEKGVRVITKDGNIEEGDLVIGADGVHSMVRDQMWDYASKNNPGLIPTSDKTAFFSEFGGFFGVSNITEDMKLHEAESNFTYGHGTTSLLFTQPGQAYWAFMFKDERSQPPKRKDGSEAAMNKAMQQFKDTPIKDDLTFGDLWEHRTRAGLLNVEEGVLSQWHAGRLVLCGDSAHKMTADIGVGANTGIESAVVLCNVLQREVKSNRSRHFSQAELSSLFDEYQNKRMKRAKMFSELSGQVTRLNSFDTYLERFINSYLGPWLSGYQIKQLAKVFAKAPKLDYAPVRTIDEDAEGWKLAKKENKGGKISQSSWSIYLIALSVLGLSVSYALRHMFSALQPIHLTR